LLRIPREKNLPASVIRYLESEAGQAARLAYKCRVRHPWYSVPDVQVPDYFLTYMSGRSSNLVRNDARCSCTNSVHAVRVVSQPAASRLAAGWNTPLAQLSCEIEGHPLGGGMLKLEPGEASRILIPSGPEGGKALTGELEYAKKILQCWRHHGTA
jgi:adenine-specific DNA-methyltransferase